MEIVWSERASKDLIKILDFLIAEWGSNVAEDFYNTTLYVIEHIRNNPEMFPPISKQKKDTRCVLLSKHNKLFYSVERDTIFILTIFDTRSHPERLNL
jgi:plasmid stabilization system protein ParE